MSFNPKLFILALIVSLIIILTASLKSKHFLKSVFLSAFSGLGGLFAVYVLSLFTYLSLPVNLFTVAVSAVGGIPGVVALLVTAFTV